MRERLIKLLKQAEKQEILNAVCGDIDSLIDSPRGAEFIADYLIENGVVVPPCKVGQTMYVISRYYGGEWKVFECKVNDITVFERNIFISLHGVNNFCFGENAEHIGKTVFLTKEEAERELKGEKK